MTTRAYVLAVVITTGEPDRLPTDAELTDWTADAMRPWRESVRGSIEITVLGVDGARQLERWAIREHRSQEAIR